MAIKRDTVLFKAFIKNYWEYFRELEGEFLQTRKYVEFCKENNATFSIEYLKLYQAVCSEIDVVGKAMAKVANASFKPEDKQNNIPVDKRTKIKVVFFSPGGDLEVNNCLVDTIQLSTTPVVGINVGMAASSGCFIYLACHERYTFPTAEFLLHKGAGQFAGNYNDVVAAILNYQRQIEELGKFVLSRTKIPENIFYENFENDWYLSANEAVEYGVADGIIKSLDEIL